MSVDDTMEVDSTGTEPTDDMGPDEACDYTEVDFRADVMWTGRYRVYFNAREEAPRVWSIDDGDPKTEVKVEEIYIYTSAFSKFDANSLEPKAWFEGFGTVIVADGVAIVEEKNTPTVRTTDNPSI